MPQAAHRNNLNVLRATAVLAVCISHLAHYSPFKTPYLGEFGGLLGVQLFFLISGFLMLDSAGSRSFWRFVGNRAFRLFPAYWVALLCASLWVTQVLPIRQAGEWPYFLANFWMLGHAVPYALSHYDALTVAWTLTVEWCWYLLVPLLLWLARGPGGAAPADAQQAARAVRRRWRWIWLATAAASTAWVLLAQRGHLDPLYAHGFARLQGSPDPLFLRYAFIVNAAPAHLVFFVTGALLKAHADQLHRIPAWLCLLTIAGLLFDPSRINAAVGVNPSLFSGLGLAAAMILVLRLPVLRFAPLHWIGTVSYPLYLLHVPALSLVFHRWQWHGMAALGAWIGGLLLASALLHYLVERPFQKLSARYT